MGPEGSEGLTYQARLERNKLEMSSLDMDERLKAVDHKLRHACALSFIPVPPQVKQGRFTMRQLVIAIFRALGLDGRSALQTSLLSPLVFKLSHVLPLCRLHGTAYDKINWGGELSVLRALQNLDGLYNSSGTLKVKLNDAAPPDLVNFCVDVFELPVAAACASPPPQQALNESMPGPSTPAVSGGHYIVPKRFVEKCLLEYMQTVLLFLLDFLCRRGLSAAVEAQRKLDRSLPDSLLIGFYKRRHCMIYALADTTALWQIAHWIGPFVSQLGLGALGSRQEGMDGPTLLLNLCVASVCLNEVGRLAAVATPQGLPLGACVTVSP
jgi:hypothetical protein